MSDTIKKQIMGDLLRRIEKGEIDCKQCDSRGICKNRKPEFSLLCVVGTIRNLPRDVLNDVKTISE